MEFKAVQKRDWTVFWTKNEPKLIELLKQAGIKNIEFIKDASKVTTHLNRRLNNNQIKAYRYRVGLLKKTKKVIEKKEIPKIIKGFKGCLLTGISLKFESA